MPSPNSQDVDNGQDAHVQEEQGAAVPGSDVEQDETMEDDAANGNDESAGNNRAVVDREEATATDVLADVSGLEGVKRLLGKDKTFEEYITVAGYVYEEKVTGTWFDMPLDGATNETDLVSKEPSRAHYEVVNLGNNPTGFESVAGTVECFCVLTAFGERGPFSGHCYQPFVNHRQMSFTSITMPHKVNDANVPALIDSMVKPTESNSFSLGNLMSLYAYELKESDDVNLPMIESPAALAVPGTGTDRTRIMTGTLKGHRARQVTVEGWIRLLHVFGQKRQSKYDSLPVAVEEIVSFLEDIGKQELSNVEQLGNFIRRHKMEWLYTVSRKRFEDQVNAFFALIRALVPFRLAAYDGRHRFNLCCCFATGYYNLIPEIPMVRSSKPKSPLKSAVFVKQKFILSQPDSDHKTTPLLDLMGNLRNSGVLTTANQALNVESSWATLIPEYIAYAHRTGHFAKLVKFNYTTFWEPTADETSKNVAINLNILWGAFQNFVKEASETRGPLVIGATNLKLTEVLSTCNPVKSNKLKSWQNPLGKGRDGKPPKNAPRNLITFASVLRYVCDDIPLIMNIRDLLASPPTTYPQNKVPVKDQDQETIEFFRDINFIRIYVLGTSTAAADHLIERVLVERAMLHALRTKLDGEKGEAVKEDLEKHWPSMPCANIKDVFHEVNEVLKNKVEEEKKPKKPKNSKQSKGKTTKKREFKGRRPLNDVDVQYIGNGTKLTGKLNFAIQSTLFRDIVKTMLKYGMNPKVTFVGENNHKLHLLVNGVSFYTTYIPDYRPDRFIKVPPGKFIMILLIELYLEWLVLTLPLDTAAFVLIRNICPNPSDLNEYETPPDSGCQLNGAVVNVPGRIKKLEDIVCQDLTFSFFVDGVLSGRINTDGLPKFSQHMATSYEAMEEAYHKLEERHQDNPSYSLPAYKPPPKPKAKSSGSKTKVKPGFSFFEKQLKNAYTFPGSDEEVEDDDNNTSGDYEKKDLAKTFLELLEQNAIVSVKFRQSTLRDLYAADSTPKSGIGTSLLTAVDNFLSVKKLAQKETAKERREAAKKRSAESVEEEESSQDASQETSPVRQSPRIKRKKTSQEADQEDSSETKADDDQDPDDDNQSSSDKSEGGDVENPDEDDDNQ